MQMLAPECPVYQAGTLAGNPLALSAGYATLYLLDQNDIYLSIREKADYLYSGMAENFKQAGIPVVANSVESMGCFF